MDPQHLSQDEFFDRLGELFNRRKGSDHGAIYLTQKRLTYAQDCPRPAVDNPFPDLKPGKPMPVIIRASNGKSKRERAEKVKLSTIVQPHDLEGFYTRYADVCKAGMAALKPRDRSKRKAKARKKKAAS
ncbi:hypothetical protein TOPH_02146 [Tolypocladium ophioglossoides CBS 100239]|uniref:Signal recognition particle subunit SRP14 n=1 Tax=Tolypocladium ophioglossoides (strain CBS 100239) TaxID=1163406 RepID=A0A0L0NGR4_TOLOC|nr:hypothetical protein TOPH_02146 [Tolypocladium ophioglossoides CBS 100239]